MKLGGWLVMLTALIMFLTLIGLPTSLNSILETVGVNINEETAQLNTSSDMESSSFWSNIFGTGGFLIILAGGATIVAIGLFARGYDPSLILLPLVVFVAGLYITTFWTLIKYVSTFNQAWATSVVGIVLASLAVGFAMSCVDYFAGR